MGAPAASTTRRRGHAQSHDHAIDRRANRLAIHLVLRRAQAALRSRAAASMIARALRRPSADSDCARRPCARPARRSAAATARVRRVILRAGCGSRRRFAATAASVRVARSLRLASFSLSLSSSAESRPAVSMDSIWLPSAAACACASRTCVCSALICSSSVRRRAENCSRSRARCSRARGSVESCASKSKSPARVVSARTARMAYALGE